MAIESTSPQSTDGGASAPQSPSAPSPEGAGQQPASPAQTGVQPASPASQPDWRQSPEFRGIAKQIKQANARAEAAEKKAVEFEAKFNGFQSGMGQRQSPVSQEDESALERVFSLAFQSPKVMGMIQEKLGLGKLGELEKGLGELSQSWYSSQAEGERAEILADAKKLGLDPDQVSEELDRQLEEHPLYSQLNYKRGALKAVYRDLFFDRAGEFRERANNAETIQKRDALKRGQVQQSGQPNGKAPAKSGEEAFHNAIRDAGGLGGIDFTR